MALVEELKTRACSVLHQARSVQLILHNTPGQGCTNHQSGWRIRLRTLKNPEQNCETCETTTRSTVRRNSSATSVGSRIPNKRPPLLVGPGTSATLHHRDRTSWWRPSLTTTFTRQRDALLRFSSNRSSADMGLTCLPSTVVPAWTSVRNARPAQHVVFMHGLGLSGMHEIRGSKTTIFKWRGYLRDCYDQLFNSLAY